MKHPVWTSIEKLLLKKHNKLCLVFRETSLVLQYSDYFCERAFDIAHITILFIPIITFLVDWKAEIKYTIDRYCWGRKYKSYCRTIQVTMNSCNIWNNN